MPGLLEVAELLGVRGLKQDKEEQQEKKVEEGLKEEEEEEEEIRVDKTDEEEEAARTLKRLSEEIESKSEDRKRFVSFCLSVLDFYILNVCCP